MRRKLKPTPGYRGFIMCTQCRAPSQCGMQGRCTWRYLRELAATLEGENQIVISQETLDRLTAEEKWLEESPDVLPGEITLENLKTLEKLYVDLKLLKMSPQVALWMVKMRDVLAQALIEMAPDDPLHSLVRGFETALNTVSMNLLIQHGGAEKAFRALEIEKEVNAHVHRTGPDPAGSAGSA